MTAKLIYLLVEGDDDERFANRIIRPQLSKIHDLVITWKYAQKKKEKVRNLLRTVHQTGATYFYMCDLDKFSCVTKRKVVEQNWLPILDVDRIIVVKRDIECWYAAGASDEIRRFCNLTIPADTQVMSKEHLTRLVSPRMTRTEFMLQVLEDYSFALAHKRNDSFSYAWNRFTKT